MPSWHVGSRWKHGRHDCGAVGVIVGETQRQFSPIWFRNLNDGMLVFPTPHSMYNYGCPLMLCQCDANLMAFLASTLQRAVFQKDSWARSATEMLDKPAENRLSVGATSLST